MTFHKRRGMGGKSDFPEGNLYNTTTNFMFQYC